MKVLLEGKTVQEALEATNTCATLTVQAIGTAKFNLTDHFDLVIYCYAVRFDIVTNGTVDLNISKVRQVVNSSKLLPEAQRSRILNMRCRNFVDCILQPCNVSVNQLGVIVPSLQ